VLAKRLGGVAQGGQHSSAGSGNYRLSIVTSRVRVHTKVLTAPAVPLTTLFQNMREVYATVNIEPRIALGPFSPVPLLGLPFLTVYSVAFRVLLVATVLYVLTLPRWRTSWKPLLDELPESCCGATPRWFRFGVAWPTRHTCPPRE
jgi:hypothetical protein